MSQLKGILAINVDSYPRLQKPAIERARRQKNAA
jgi:hypothetical protein